MRITPSVNFIMQNFLIINFRCIIFDYISYIFNIKFIYFCNIFYRKSFTVLFQYKLFYCFFSSLPSSIFSLSLSNKVMNSTSTEISFLTFCTLLCILLTRFLKSFSRYFYKIGNNCFLN